MRLFCFLFRGATAMIRSRTGDFRCWSATAQIRTVVFRLRTAAFKFGTVIPGRPGIGVAVSNPMIPVANRTLADPNGIIAVANRTIAVADSIASGRELLNCSPELQH